MEIVKRIARMRELVRDRKGRKETVGFVPTMGALHEGHMSLVRRAQQSTDHVVMSIYVNPTQFGPGEDFAAYPRDIHSDTELAKAASVDELLLPETKELYPQGFRTFVEVQDLGDRLCGRTRPGHFRGVATVVAKLLAVVEPSFLFLGEKDAQQLVILRRMAADLNFPVEVVGCPTVREPDGLARSSRNAYLSPQQRQAAPALYRALGEAERAFQAGERRGSSIAARLRAALAQEPLFKLDYAEVVDPETLDPVNEVAGTALLAVAGWVGRTRLIDNVMLGAVREGGS